MEEVGGVGGVVPYGKVTLGGAGHGVQTWLGIFIRHDDNITPSTFPPSPPAPVSRLPAFPPHPSLHLIAASPSLPFNPSLHLIAASPSLPFNPSLHLSAASASPPLPSPFTPCIE